MTKLNQLIAVDKSKSEAGDVYKLVQLKQQEPHTYPNGGVERNARELRSAA